MSHPSYDDTIETEFECHLETPPSELMKSLNIAPNYFRWNLACAKIEIGTLHLDHKWASAPKGKADLGNDFQF